VSDETITLTSLDPGFCARLDTALHGVELRAGGAARPGEDTTRWAVPTSYGETFRAIVVDGQQADGFVPPEMVAAARELSGLDEVVAFRVQANAMLPGQGLGRHTDVPEFWGARRWTVPDWLLVTMLHSGLHDAEQLRVISALVWPITTNGGPLRVFDRANRSLLAHLEPQPGVALVSDSTRLPHEVTTVPGDEIEAGAGDRVVLTTDGWRLRRTDGSDHVLDPAQVRTSVLVKLGCFPDRATRDRWFAATEPPLDQDAVIAALAARLPVDPRPGPALHQQLVDHFVSYMSRPA
jgi:hypothetical protein